MESRRTEGCGGAGEGPHPEQRAPLPGLGRLPPVVTGCGGLSGLDRRWSFVGKRRVFTLLDTALEGGSNAFDTAAVYGNGASETWLGRWIRERRIRERVILITKGAHPNASHPHRVGPQFLREDLHASLRRLRTDYVDLYLLHRDDPQVPVAEILEVLHGFVQEGKVRAIGASNWSHTRIEEANLHAKAHGLTPLTVSSPHFSLAEMYTPPWPGCLSVTGAAGASARAWYTAARMPLLAWSPLASGYLAGRDPTRDAFIRAYESEANRKRRKRACALAEQYGVPPVQIALAYVLSQNFEAYPVVFASSTDHLRTLLRTRVRLTADELSWLDLQPSSLDAAMALKD